LSVSEIQILNLVLDNKDYSILSDSLTDENFVEYKNEYNYVKEYYNEYKDIPSKEAFLEKFPEFKLYKVEEKKEPIIDRLNEESLFRKAVSVYNKASELISADSRQGIEYLRAELKKLDTAFNVSCTNFGDDAENRYNRYMDRVNHVDSLYYDLPKDLKELTPDFHGFRTNGDDLIVLSAKSGVGKSWITFMLASCLSKQTKTLIVSPEMSTEDASLRIDTYNGHFSNTNLMSGYMVVGYKEYIEKAKEEYKNLYIADLENFRYKITMQKIKNMCKSKEIGALFIDDISYIELDSKVKFDSEANRLGMIVQELKVMSVEFNIPIIIVAQAKRRSSESNRDSDSISDAESIFGSYKITQKATRVITINKQKDTGAILFYITKNRYGKEGGKFLYLVDLDTMSMSYIPNLDDISQNKELSENVQKFKEDVTSIF
jgi:replicative DNA helicase